MAPPARRILALFLTAMTLPGTTGAFSSDALCVEASGPVLRLRAADAKAASVIRIGLERSPTFREISERLERGDVVVYVQTRPMRLPGQLQFVSCRAGWRYVRVSVRVPAMDAVLVAWLGHELQHAVEIAGAPEIVDEASLVRYYQRTGGMLRSAGTLETGQAQQAWRRIRDELR